MSLSNPRPVVQNPATKFIDFDGKKGGVFYYDKESKSNIDLPLPFTFIILDVLKTIRGYSDKYECGIYSNEVHDTTKESLTVKVLGNKTKNIKSAILATGIYKNIENNIKAAGGKFSYSVYGVTKINGTWELVNVMFTGSQCSAWIEFSKGKNFDNGLYVVIKDFVAKKKGSNDYMECVPSLLNDKKGLPAQLSEDAKNMAIDFDKVLQKYFVDKKALRQDEPETDKFDDNEPENTTAANQAFDDKPIQDQIANSVAEEDDLPF